MRFNKEKLFRISSVLCLSFCVWNIFRDSMILLEYKKSGSNYRYLFEMAKGFSSTKKFDEEQYEHIQAARFWFDRLNITFSEGEITEESGWMKRDGTPRIHNKNWSCRIRHKESDGCEKMANETKCNCIFNWKKSIRFSCKSMLWPVSFFICERLLLTVNYMHTLFSPLFIIQTFWLCYRIVCNMTLSDSICVRQFSASLFENRLFARFFSSSIYLLCAYFLFNYELSTYFLLYT